MFYLLPNMPPILENSCEDEVSIAMVEFEKKKSLQRYSRYGSTLPDDNCETDKLANALLKNSELSIKTDEARDYDTISKRMKCAKKIQYAAGFATLITILIVLIVTTIQSGHTPELAPHRPQTGHSHRSNPSDLGFDINIANNNEEIDSNSINDNLDSLINDELDTFVNDNINKNDQIDAANDELDEDIDDLLDIDETDEN